MKQLYKVLLCSGMTVVASSILAYCNAPLLHSSESPNEQWHSASSLPQPQETAASWLDLGAEAALKGDYQSAVTNYNQSLQLEPFNPDTYYNRGVAYYNLGQQQQSLQDFTTALKLNPQMAEAHGNRGELRLQLGDLAGAKQDFQQAAKLFKQQGELATSQRMQLESEQLR